MVVGPEEMREFARELRETAQHMDKAMAKRLRIVASWLDTLAGYMEG